MMKLSDRPDSGTVPEYPNGFLSRRGFIRLTAASLLATQLPACKESRTVGYRPNGHSRTSYITPNDEFYMVAVDTSFRPAVTVNNVKSNWSLPVRGLDNEVALRFGYDDLVNSARHVVPYTFECIGNPVGGHLIGNARWHVLPLKTLINKASGGSRNVKSVMFEGLDDFYSSVSAERVMDDYAFVAVKMNNDSLPPAHGFPARIILPDLYGMKQPRWLRSITLLEDSDTTSYWEKRGWAGEVPVKTMSRIDPRSPISAKKSAEITGIAFAGARGIKKVEISLDDGNSWRPCELIGGVRSQTWSLWRYEWLTPTAGKYQVKVRAVDGHGILQTPTETRRFPDGATGYDTRSVIVRNS